MDYLGKGEVLTNTDLDRFVNKIWYSVYIIFYFTSVTLSSPVYLFIF